MILFFAPGGRLGNLLFQVTFLESIRRPQERIFTINLFRVHRMFPGLRRYYNTDFRPFTRLVDKVLHPLFCLLFVKTRVFSSITERDAVQTVRKGLLSWRYISGNFQFPYSGKSPFVFRSDPLQKARRVLAEAEERVPIFVHIRRGDYEQFVVGGGIRPLLPGSFYQKALDWLQSRVPEAHVFLLGDSPDWARELFGHLPHKTVSPLGPLEDLALMSQCHGGVISNSTFAWWGAALCTRQVPVVAPRYWLGWPAYRWWPASIESPWLTYLDVDALVP
jgi:hypothetical protein